MNCLPYQEYTKYNLFREKLNISESTKIFLYQGEFTEYKLKGIDTIIESFEQAGSKLDFAIVFLGYGRSFDSYSKKYSGHSNVYFHPAVSLYDYMKYVSSADAGIFILDPVSLSSEYSLANKIFEYIAAGLPIIVSGLKEMRSLVNNAGIGFVLNQNSKDSLVDMLYKIKTQNLEVFKNRIERAYLIYNWENQEKVLAKIYDSVSK
jgi:glycosyltransferase involved in cell wall biosynthesis